MTAYTTDLITPGTITDGVSPFDGTQVNDAFDDLAEVLAGDVEAGASANIRDTAILPWHAFQPGAISQVWSSGSAETATFLGIVDDSSPATTTWGTYHNSYDVDDTGVDFELHAAATVRFYCTVNMEKGRDTWTTSHPTNYGQGWKLHLYINDTLMRTAYFQYAPRAGNDEQMGFPMTVSHIDTSVNAGKWRAYARIELEDNFDHATYTGAGGTYPQVTQWLSRSRYMAVHALYR